MAKETKEQPLFYIPKHNTEMDSKAIWFKSGIIHSNWKKTTIWNISFCLFLPRKKKIIMEWDKQWKLHCNSDRFIDNLVWDNQLYIWYCVINLRGRDIKYVAIYPIHKLDTFSFFCFFSKHLSSTSVNWQNPEITDPVQIFQSPSIIWQPNTFEKR